VTDTIRIAVLGAGSWGTTLGILLHENGHDVTLWEFDPRLAEALARERENTTFLPGIRVPESIAVTSDIGEAVRRASLLLFVVPTHTMRATARAVVASGALAGDEIVVGASKGLEEGTLARMSEVLGAELPVPSERILALMGPSHAEEVSRRVPTSVVVAGIDEGVAREAQRVFSRPYFRVYTNSDLVGVEIGVALKNSIAIAAGILDGLGYGDNTKAALVTRGLVEIARLGEAMGAARETFSGLAGVGDLVVTCLSRHSRNRHVGEQIGRGKSLQEVLDAMVMVAEGVRTTRAAVEMGRRHDVELPIIEMVYQVLFEGRDPRESVDALMTRPLRQEMPGQPNDEA
jgi:glycerol-3-phosphate dehydrogenase (NAD(P)+)